MPKNEIDKLLGFSFRPEHLGQPPSKPKPQPKPKVVVDSFGVRQALGYSIAESQHPGQPPKQT